MTPENLTLADIKSMMDRLTEIVGLSPLATACGLSHDDPATRWAAGTDQPDGDELERLLVVNEVVTDVADSESPSVAYMWFLGTSCGPDRMMSPCEAIRVGNYDDARASARDLKNDNFWS